MKFLTMTHTDIGKRPNNEDSVCVLSKIIKGKQVCFAVVCDGIGGLSNGDYASKTVVEHFKNWIENSIVCEPEVINLPVVAQKLIQELRLVNYDLVSYGIENSTKIGTTFTGLLIVDEQYLIVHVGDTRVYFVDDSVNQLTEDHTLAAFYQKKDIDVTNEMYNELSNKLYQCIGANNKFEPQVIMGKNSCGTFLICSDGFRHKLSENEMLSVLNNSAIKSTSWLDTERKVHVLIEKIKERGEKDNITVALINISEM